MNLSPLLIQRFVDNNGNSLVGGLLYTYVAGTTTPQATYTDSTGSVSNPNPVVMNSRGEANVWLDPTKTYKFLLTDQYGNQIWSVDNVPGNTVAFPAATYYGTDSGSANAYSITFTPTVSAFTPSAGAIVEFYAANANTGPSTLNANGSGAKTILSQYGVALSGGEINPATPTWVQYNGTQWQIVSSADPTKIRTAAEISAGVTPVNYGYVPGNVLRYGADPGGVSDSTTAIQNTINANSVVYLPTGNYKTTATLTVAAGKTVYGDGMLKSTIVPTTAVTGAVLSYTPGSLTTAGITLRDFGFSGNSTTLYNIQFTNCTAITLKRLYSTGFNNVSAYSVLWTNVEDSLIEGCYWLNIGAVGIQLATNSNNNTILQCSFTPALTGSAAISLDSTTVGTNILGNNFEGHGGGVFGNVAISCGGSTSTNIDGNFMENWSGACVSANSGIAINLRIANNQMNALTAAAAIAVLNSTGPNDRVTLENNTLMLLGNGGQTSVGFLLGATTNIWARGNKSTGSGTVILSIAGVIQTFADYLGTAGQLLAINGRPVQQISYTASLSVNAAAGEIVQVGALTGALAVAAPTNPIAGQQLEFHFLQDGTGGRAVTWNAVFIRTSWSDAGNVANSRSSIRFTCNDGSNWFQSGAQKAYT